GAVEDDIRRTSDGRSGGVANNDSLKATDRIAAFVSSGPGARDNLCTATSIADGIRVTDRNLAARVLSRSHSGCVGGGISRALEQEVRGAGDNRFCDIADGDHLHATDGI